MITAKEASDQVERMSGLDFFPRGKDQSPALKELRLALQSAANARIAEQAVTDILGYCTESPKPAQLRSVIWELNEKLAKRVSDCTICGGSGSETVWVLITYRGRSLTVERSEIMPNMTQDRAMQLAKKLEWDDGPGNNQQIVAAARVCRCRGANGNQDTTRSTGQVES